MYILGIDTSSNILTVALSCDNKIVTEIHCDRQMGLLENLAPTVDDILYGQNISVNDLGLLAISLGPGSFTGLRIGMAFAKTLSFAQNIPIVGVPTLKAMAKTVQIGFCDYICPLVHARVDEVYCAMFSGDLKENPVGYTFMTINEFLENPKLKNSKTVFLGTGANKHSDLIKSICLNCEILDENYNFARGSAINSLAFEVYEKGACDDAKTLVPMYIKKPTPVIRKEKGII